jgi:hypothetical protein
VRDPKQFESVVVARRGGLALTLADLGSWSSARRSPTRWPASTASGINFNVFKQQDANIVDRRRREEGHGRAAQDLPPDVELR